MTELLTSPHPLVKTTRPRCRRGSATKGGGWQFSRERHERRERKDIKVWVVRL
ncbi:hypothetical protein HanRHA438_Chr01g0019961 [Helianthus annuus]|nr:hypothetical protein HanRHA438_Chr01g0019961 [Helianthus annuus]